jgi:Ca2+/Na+ antiporter
MAKGKWQKDKQYNGQRKTTNFCRFPLAIILFVLLSLSFGHYTVYPFLFSFSHYIFCPYVVFQYNGHRKNEKRTNNIMIKGKRQKDNEYNGKRKTPRVQTIFVVFLWPLYCLSFCRFPLAIILSVLLSFSFGDYIFYPFVVFL